MLVRIILSVLLGRRSASKFERRARKIIKFYRKLQASQRLKYTYTHPYKRVDIELYEAKTESELKETFHKLLKARVLHVIDGDTVIVRAGMRDIKVRLDSIDCPEDGQYWGDTATFGLIKLIGGKIIRLEEHGIDVYGRTLATLYALNKKNNEWMNVNERMVTLGHAWVMRRFYNHLPSDRKAKLNRLERWAKSKQVGLWHDPDPIPPWQWRNEDALE